MSGIREGRWLCKFCGSEELGRHESCTGCGAARQPGTRFYLPENSPYVTDRELLSDAKSGVDWNCSHCGGANKGSIQGRRVSQCVHCGNSRQASDKDDVVRHFGVGQAPSTAKQSTQAEREELLQNTRTREASRRAPSSARALYPSRQSNRSSGPNPNPALLLCVGAALFSVLIGFLIWSFAFARYEASFEIESRHWSRSIEIEEYRTLNESGFSHPSDARIHYTERRISHYVQVVVGSEKYPCGTEDMGNGYFKDKTCYRDVTRRDPVYATYYHYSIDRWVHDHYLRTQGIDFDRKWAQVPVLDRKHREGSRSESLGFVLVDHEAQKSNWYVSEAEWLKIQTGQRMEAVTDFWGRIVSYDIVG